jgi:hypothetical protein
LFEQKLLDVNRPIKDNGTTMLHTAAWFQRPLLIKALLELEVTRLATDLDPL